MREFRDTRPGTLDHYDASARITIDNRSRLAWERYGLVWEDSLNRNSRGEVEASVAGVLRGSRPIPGFLGGVRNDASFPPGGNRLQDSEKRAGPQKFDGVDDRSQNGRDAKASDTVGCCSYQHGRRYCCDGGGITSAMDREEATRAETGCGS